MLLGNPIQIWSCGNNFTVVNLVNEFFPSYIVVYLLPISMHIIVFASPFYQLTQQLLTFNLQFHNSSHPHHKQIKQMKKQNQQCKQHIALIEQLLTENNSLKQKYDNLLKEYEKLRHKYTKLAHQSSHNIDQQGNKEQGNDVDGKKSLKNQHQMKIQNNRFSRNVDVQIGDIDFQEVLKFGEEHKMTVKNKGSLDDAIEKKPPQLRNSRSSSRSSSMLQRSFPLIQGCFILQKKSCYSKKQKNSLSQMLQFVYPQQLAKTEKQTLEMMLKYTFTNPEITKSEDDQFSSRRNQITFGTPFEDYMYAFEDGKWVGRKQLPEIMKLMGTTKKKYFHILLKPQIIQKQEIQIQQVKQLGKQENQQHKMNEEWEEGNQGQIKDELQKQSMKEQVDYFYQTQVIYGFVSPFPLRQFFQDLHRTTQQQLKYSQFEVNSKQQQVYNPIQNRKNKYKIMSQIMKKLYEYEYTINKFPLHMLYNTGITKLELNIQNVVQYRDIQDQFLNAVLCRYDPGKISRFLHYVLLEKCLLLEVADRRSLNQLFEVMRVMIRPFLWMFAVVYVYSDYFQPLMSSPMPIIIGKITQPNSSSQSACRTSIDYSQFCHIMLNNREQDKVEHDAYEKPIKKLKKQLQKCENSGSSSGNKKQTRASIIHSYIHSLRVFIEKGILNSQPTDFHIQFMDTQMVSYFKEIRDDV